MTYSPHVIGASAGPPPAEVRERFAVHDWMGEDGLRDGEDFGLVGDSKTLKLEQTCEMDRE